MHMYFSIVAPARFTFNCTSAFSTLKVKTSGMPGTIASSLHVACSTKFENRPLPDRPWKNVLSAQLAAHDSAVYYQLGQQGG